MVAGWIMALPFLQGKYELLGWGDLGLVFKISDYVELKYSATKEWSTRFWWSCMPSSLSSYHLRFFILSFYAAPCWGNSEMRLRTRQRKDPITGQFFEGLWHWGRAFNSEIDEGVNKCCSLIAISWACTWRYQTRESMIIVPIYPSKQPASLTSRENFDSKCMPSEH